MQTHIGSIDDFAEWTKEDLQARYNIPDMIIDSIEETLSFYGVYFRRPLPSGLRSGTKAESAQSDPVVLKKEPAPQKSSQTISKPREASPSPSSGETPHSDTKPVTAADSIDSLHLSRMTENRLKEAGYSKVDKLLSLYQRKGTKGFGSIPKFNSEMQKELLQELKHHKLI
jgi:hypothetical protein